LKLISGLGAWSFYTKDSLARQCGGRLAQQEQHDVKVKQVWIFFPFLLL
jgi:hypothetical protein